MTRNKILPVPFKLERLTIVLADEVAQAGLCEPDPGAQLGVERPLELLWRGVDCVGGRGRGLRVSAWGFVGLGVWGERSVEERRRGRVNGACEKHETLGEDVCREPG